MRLLLPQGSIVTLENESHGKIRLRILNILGEGATSIAYEVCDVTSQIRFILKECFPSYGAKRDTTGNIIWDSPEFKEDSQKRIYRAFNAQLSLQNNPMTVNINSSVVAGILQGNNTIYTLSPVHNASCYNEVGDSSIYETLITCRAIARAAGAYHKNGFLHLDIKPQNIMIYPETRDMIMLIDFDSVVHKGDFSACALSYSNGYASPEQLQGNYRKISEASDIYAIGAIMFNRIFGSTPEAEDRSKYKHWDFCSIEKCKKLSKKAERLVSEVLHKSLAASPNHRFKSTDEMIDALDSAIEECRPGKRFIESTFPLERNQFVGRGNETDEIKRFLIHNEIPVLFLYGMGGIGKTELAIHIANTPVDSIDTICFGKYNGSIKELLSDRDFIRIANSEDNALDDFRSLVDTRTLLIVDDMNNPEDPDLSSFLSLKCKFIFTTRTDFRDIYPNFSHIHLEALPNKEQFSLFRSELGDSYDVGMDSAIYRILNYIQGYTLLIPLIAKQYRKGFYTLEEIADRISVAGILDVSNDRIAHNKDRFIRDSISNILSAVLNMTELSSSEKYILGSLALLKGVMVRRKPFLRWVGAVYNSALNNLIEDSWIQSYGRPGPDEILSCHEVVRQVFVKDYSAHISDYSWIRVLIDEYLTQINTFCDSPSCQKIDFTADTGTPIFIWEIESAEKSMFRLKARMIERILQNADLTWSEDMSFIIDFFYRICDCELSKAIYFTDNSMRLLSSVTVLNSFELLTADTKIKAYYLLYLFTLRDFYRIRSEGEAITENDLAVKVQALVSAGLKYEDYFIHMQESYEIDADRVLKEYKNLFYPTFECIVSYGMALYDCGWYDTCKEASDLHLNYFRKLYERLPPALKKEPYIRENLPFLERKLSYKPVYPEIVNSCFDEKTKQFDLSILNSIEKEYSFADIQDKDLRKHMVTMAKIADKHDHIFCLLICVEKLGYADFSFPSLCLRQSAKDPMSWIKAESIFNEIDRIYAEKHELEKTLDYSSLDFSSQEPPIPTYYYEDILADYYIDRCILCSCENNSRKAIGYFKMLIESRISYVAQVPKLYRLLRYYECESIASALLLKAIEHSKQYLIDSEDTDEKILLLESLVECCQIAELFDDANSYEKQRQELLNTDFVIA